MERSYKAKTVLKYKFAAPIMGLGVFVGENVAHYFFAPCNCHFSPLKNVGKNAHTDMIADGQATEQSKCLTRKKKLSAS